MRSGRDEVRHLLRLAREELAFAEGIAAGNGGGAPRHACLWAQQVAEKTLGAALTLEGLDFNRNNDLELLRAGLPAGWRAKDEPRSLQILAGWALDAQEDADWPEATEADARLAARQAREVWDIVAADLYTRGFDVATELP